MALVPNATPITILASHKASYTPTLSPDGIQTLPAATPVLVFPDGVDTTVPANAIASGAIGPNGVCSTVDLIPGCIYRVTTTAGNFASARFCASGTVGPVVRPGDNVTGV
jgi:hypothetical protein